MNDDPKPQTTRLPIDERPGRLPQITSEDLDIAYTLVVRGTRGRIKLVLRCDATGGLWASIRGRD